MVEISQALKVYFIVVGSSYSILHLANFRGFQVEIVHFLRTFKLYNTYLLLRFGTRQDGITRLAKVASIARNRTHLSISFLASHAFLIHHINIFYYCKYL